MSFLQESKANDQGAVNAGGQTATAGSTPDAKNAQMSQGLDLAHGNVSELIASGESKKGNNNPYGTFNYYKAGGGLGSSYFGLIDGKPIYQHTFESLEKLSQSGSTLNISYTDGDKPMTCTGRLFATGKYQMIPSTRNAARGACGLKNTDLFSEQNQDLCYTKHLIKGAVMNYYNGTGSIEAAAKAIAQTWAAIGIKPGSINNYGKTGNNNGLTSYYDGDGVNAASISYDRIIAALQADKAAIDAGGIATRTVDSTAGQPGSVIPAENAQPTSDAGSSQAQSELQSQTKPANASIDINHAVSRNKRLGYSRDQWKEIQAAVGLKGSDVDGYVGKITTQAIANWQLANGFTGGDVDGICGPKTLAAIKNQGTKTPDTPATTELETPVVTEPEKPAKTSATANVDLDRAVKSNQRLGYSRAQWKEIQAAVGLTGSEVDGYVGKVTSQAIANWQLSYGFTGNDVDGICGPKTLAAIRGTKTPETPAVTVPPTETPAVTEPEKPAKEEEKPQEDSSQIQLDSDDYTGNETVKYGQNNNKVKTLQKLLNVHKAGRYGNNIGVDGSFGKGTATALMRFQYHHVKSATEICSYLRGMHGKGKSICDAETWAKLRMASPAYTNEKGKAIAFDYNNGQPVSYTPADIHGANGAVIGKLSANAAPDFDRMAKAGGINGINSSFRGMTDEATVAVTNGVGGSEGCIELYVDRGFSPNDAAYPGYSYHSSGNAVDVSGIPKHGSNSLYVWLTRNASNYGFKGFSWEHWHWYY